VNVPQTVYVGQPVELQVLITGTVNVDQPEIPATSGYELSYRGALNQSSQTVIMRDGRFSQQNFVGYCHSFSFTVRHPGTIVIPSFTVICDGRPFQTREVRLNALEPAQTADFRLELTPEKTRVYAGEPVRLTLTWLLGKPIKDYTLNLPHLPGGVEILPGPDPRPAGVSQRDPRFVDIPIGGDNAVATVSRRDLDGRQVDAVTIERILIAREPGTLHFGPARADFNAVVGQRPRRFMDSPFDDLSILERQSAATKPFDIEVVPLPNAGRPADFSGLIGNYSVVASAEPTDVTVGEPINLRITVNGPQPLSLIPLVDLNTQPGIASKFRVPRDPSLPIFTPVGAMFTYPIRARSPETKQIPPIELSYFDTSAGEYRTARSAPITINVRPSTGVDIDFDDEGEVASATAKPSSRVDATPLTLTAASFDFASAIRSPATLAALTAPPAAFAALWLGLAVRRHAAADPARGRRRRAVRHARARIARFRDTGDPVATSAAISHALTDLAADWFDRPAGSLTSLEATALLVDQTDECAGPLGRLLADCDRIRFGTESDRSAEGVTPLLTRSREVLTQVARRLEGRA
jgi:hypothetical protein